MNPTIRQLTELCEIDRAAQALREQLERYPRLLADLDAREQGAAQAEADAKARHKAAREALRKIELDIAGQSEHINKYLLQQSPVKTNKEYQAITFEIDTVKGKIDALETTGLEDIEAEGRAEAEMRRAAQTLATLRKDNEAERGRIQGQIREKQGRLREAEAERLLHLQNLPEDLRENYELLNGRYPGTAVAPVREGCCGGCNFSLVQQRVLDARVGGKLVRCDNCTRILYDPAATAVG
jgi:predicted  nucleic acid-binding Zn-ribbon protein